MPSIALVSITRTRRAFTSFIQTKDIESKSLGGKKIFAVSVPLTSVSV